MYNNKYKYQRIKGFSLFLIFSLLCNIINIHSQNLIANIYTQPIEHQGYDRPSTLQEPAVVYDYDNDGLTVEQESYLFGGIYKNSVTDTDGNGINDGDEDFDSDGFTNLQELNLFNTDPIAMDSNFNGVNDGDEDIDNDGIPNLIDLSLNNQNLNPFIADTNGNGILDGNEDFDNDGVTTKAELLVTNTNPFTTDNNAVSNTLAPLTPSYSTTIMNSTNQFNTNQQAETKLTPEIVTLISQFVDYNSAYSYFKNNIETDFYINSRKGAVGTFEERSGNDIDQASLLIAVLRYMGYSADYARANITITSNQLNLWIGFNNTAISEKILTDTGIRTDITKSGNNYTFPHTFVKLTVNNNIIYLDTSFKSHKLNNTIFDNIGNIIENDTTSGSLSVNIVNSMGNNYSIKPRVIDTSYTGSFSYTKTNEVSFSNITDDISDTVTFTIANNPTLRTAELYGKNITYYYKSSSSNTAIYNEYQMYKELGISLPVPAWNLNSIFNFSSVSGISGYGLYIRPTLKIGDIEYNGTTNATFGDIVDFNFTIKSNGNNYSYSTQTNAGEMSSFVFDFGVISANTLSKAYTDYVQTAFDTNKTKQLLNNHNAPPQEIYKPEYLGKLLNYIGVMYFSQIDIQDIALSSKVDIYSENPVRVGRFNFAPSRISTGSYPYQGVKLDTQGSFYMDIFGNQRNPISTKPNITANQRLNEIKAYSLNIGMYGSALEHTTLELITGVEAVSTAKILDVANNAQNNAVVTLSRNGNENEYFISENANEAVERTTVASTGLLSYLSGNSSRNDIVSALNAGYTIITTKNTVTIGNWSGTGYISVSSDRLSCGFIITGGLNGGMITSLVSMSAIANMAVDALLFYESAVALITIIAGVALTPGGIILAGVLLVGIYFIMEDMFRTINLYTDYLYEQNIENANTSTLNTIFNTGGTLIGLGAGKLVNSFVSKLKTPASQVASKVATIENQGLTKGSQAVIENAIPNVSDDAVKTIAKSYRGEEFLKATKNGDISNIINETNANGQLDDVFDYYFRNETKINKLTNDFGVDAVYDIVKYNRNLKFGADDMVYGLNNGGRLRTTRELCGGKLLNDLVPSGGVPNADWNTFSYEKIIETCDNGNKIHFDLTYIDDLTGILNNTSYTSVNDCTANELRFIKNNWESLKNTVIFYFKGEVVNIL